MKELLKLVNIWVRNDENIKRMFFYGTPCINQIIIIIIIEIAGLMSILTLTTVSVHGKAMSQRYLQFMLLSVCCKPLFILAAL